MKKPLFLLIFSLILVVGVSAQNQKHIDSLIVKLATTENDTSKVNLLNKIATDVFFVNYEMILEYAGKALELSKDIRYKKGIAEAYNNIGIYYRSKGVYDLAIDYFFNSLEIMEEINDKSGIARCYNLFGIIYYYLHNYNFSLDYYNKALEINLEQNDKKWIAGNYNNVGMIYEKLGEYGLALEYYFKSLEANIELNNKNWIANNYGNIGSLYLETGNPKSLEYFQKRLQLNTELNDLSGIAQSNYLIGRYYTSQDQLDSAINYLRLGYVLADSIGNLYLINNIAKELSEAYAGTANYKEALSFHELHNQLNDSLYFEDNAKKITRLELQYKFRKDEQLNEIKLQKTRLIRTSIATTLVMVFLLILLFIARQRENIKQNKLEEKKLNLENELLKAELKHKDKTFEDNVKYLMLKNDLITKVSERLIKEKPLFRKENQKIIEGIIIDLQSSKDDEILQEFEVRFNQAYAGFVEQLNKCSDDLTPNEKKLCTFIKLKMSTKEISSLTGQSISSIETARTRLRKKLNLQEKEISLHTFLENL